MHVEKERSVYIFGGCNSSYEAQECVYKYDITNDNWDTTVEPMTTKRNGLAVVQVNNVLYAIGGTSSHYYALGSLDTVETYDMNNDHNIECGKRRKWVQLPSSSSRNDDNGALATRTTGSCDPRLEKQHHEQQEQISRMHAAYMESKQIPLHKYRSFGT